MTHFGHWLKARRERLDFTQASLAAQIGVSMATVRNWEHAERIARISVPIKAALADTLRMTLLELESVGRGERSDVPIGPAPKNEPEKRPMVHIENYERAKGLLKGVATHDFTIRHTGHMPHKFTPADVLEFGWIMEDDSMDGANGYRVGDVVMFAEAKGIPPGSDVMVQIHGRCLGVVRRIFYEIEKGSAILFALNTKYPPQSVSLKDVSMMAMAVAVFRAV
ncbi:MAG: helix-turn-helix domain-containing protein [Bacillota bacterium]